MATVEIYSTNYCPYCMRAKQLLGQKGVQYTEIDVTNDDAGRATMIEKAGGKRTVPQIFINGQHIGGFDDINALNQKGELDKLLGA